ncbi:MAG: hypothetical protein ACYCY9_02325 [Thiobacillus sp.]
MQCVRNNQWGRLASVLLASMAFSSAGLAAVPDTHAAVSLHAKYVSLGERLRHNPFQRALALDSAESNADLKGDIYALVDYPFATVSAALNDPGHWCDVLILHINTKYCRATTDQATTALSVNIGKKTPQSLDDAYPIEFVYRGAAATSKYLEIQLNAQAGPLSTSNYRIQLQAVPIGRGRTFLHLTYSYDYGLAGRLAMKTYLATLGSGKVGFTLTDASSGGQPEYIGGMRGVVERNTMRYYLAIDAYLGALAEPAPVRLQKRLQRWFSATEQYPRQLHEISRTAYLDMKRREYLRQQTAR